MSEISAERRSKPPDPYRLAELLGRLRTIGLDYVRGLSPSELDAEASLITTYPGEQWSAMLAAAERADRLELLLRQCLPRHRPRRGGAAAGGDKADAQLHAPPDRSRGAGSGVRTLAARPARARRRAAGRRGPAAVTRINVHDLHDAATAWIKSPQAGGPWAGFVAGARWAEGLLAQGEIGAREAAALSEPSFARVWDNEDDAVFDEQPEEPIE